MQILKEIFRSEGVDIHGRTSHRQAVRAVAFHNKQLLMVYSPVNGDYKFPGGGVSKNEALATALKREVREECGARLLHILHEIGCIVEYDFPIKRGFDVFKMTSSYYLCEVDKIFERQYLDLYEKELEFQPAWVEIETAIRTNQAVLRSETKKPPAWTAREVFMLEYIQSHLL